MNVTVLGGKHDGHEVVVERPGVFVQTQETQTSGEIYTRHRYEVEFQVPGWDHIKIEDPYRPFNRLDRWEKTVWCTDERARQISEQAKRAFNDHVILITLKTDEFPSLQEETRRHFVESVERLAQLTEPGCTGG